jgi:hypothetical protein
LIVPKKAKWPYWPTAHTNASLEQRQMPHPGGIQVLIQRTVTQTKTTLEPMRYLAQLGGLQKLQKDS